MSSSSATTATASTIGSVNSIFNSEESLKKNLPLNGKACFDPNFHVFIERDYQDTLRTEFRFKTEYPQELEGRLEKELFLEVIERINEIFEQVSRAHCANIWENLLGFLTCQIIFLMKKTRYEKAIKSISEYVSYFNTEELVPRNLEMVDPIQRGLSVIEIRCLNR